MNFSLVTLGELLSSTNETIKRNALSILKQLQKERDTKMACIKCGAPIEIINGEPNKLCRHLENFCRSDEEREGI